MQHGLLKLMTTAQVVRCNLSTKPESSITQHYDQSELVPREEMSRRKKGIFYDHDCTPSQILLLSIA